MINIHKHINNWKSLSRLAPVLFTLSIALAACQPTAYAPKAVIPTSNSKAMATEMPLPTTPPTESPTEIAPTTPPTESPTEIAPTPTTAATNSEVTIKIADGSFTPNKVTLKVGTKVTWVNEGQHYHTVTADDGSFKSGDLANGETFSFTFTKAGVYAYYCEIHGGPGGKGMSGVVEVIE